MTTSIVSRLGRSPEEGIKAPCLTSSTVNLVLNGTGQTVGGVITGTGDRVLVRSQTSSAENGVYIVGPNEWERATDMNADNDVANGQLITDANTATLYKIDVITPWTPDSTPINFTQFAVGMPPSATFTLSDPIDLVDTTVALNVGASDPDTEQHVEIDLTAIQSKSNATTAATLFLNPVGGNVDIPIGNLILAALSLVDGRDVSVDGSAQDTHIADATIHFTEASIDHTAILNIGVNDHAAIDTHIADATLHFTEASIDHTAILNIGVNDHAAIDTHIADASIHFTEASISIPASQISDFDVEVANNASVVANTAKATNVPTALSIGTVTGTTFAITSDGGADDVVIPVFTSTDAGLVLGSGGGTANFLRADGAFASPPGAGNNFSVVVETTTARTAVAFEAVMADDDTAGAIQTITLPVGVADAMVIVKKIGSSFDVIIDGDSAETIDGALTFTLTAKYASLTVIYTGTEWAIV